MTDFLGQISKGLEIGEHIAQRPQRDALAQLGIERQQQALQAQQAQQQRAGTEFEQAQALQRAKILNQSASALKRLPFEQRDSAFERLRPRLEQFGIDVGQLEGGTLTDQLLDQSIASTQGFLSDPSKLLAEQQKGQRTERSLDIRERELELAQLAEERQSKKLSAGLEKELLRSQDETVSSQRTSREFDILADQVAEAALTGGVAASTSETFKALLGTQDDVTELRRRFNQVRLSEGLKNLPPGPATDKDMEQAFKGVPPENALASQIESFLRGAAKMARFDAGYNQFKSDFISENSTAKGMNKEWRKSVKSSVLGREVTIAEIYAEAAAEGLTPEEVKEELGIEE